MERQDRVVKCRRTVKRLPASERCGAKLFQEMEGTTWQPVSGHKRDHVPVESNDDSAKGHREHQNDDAVSYDVIHHFLN